MDRRFLSIALLSIAACTFPDPQLSNDASSGGDSGAPVDSHVVDTSGLDIEDTGPEDTTVDLDSATNPDAFPEIGPDADPCDLDGDTFKSAKDCGGDDCNDHTPEAHPGVTTFIRDSIGTDDLLWTTLPGDWNCDGTVKYEFPQQACTTGGLGNCVGKLDGYASDPTTLRCGDPIGYSKCKVVGTLGCGVDTTDTTRLGCM
jgi:hypothetical protein